MIELDTQAAKNYIQESRTGFWKMELSDGSGRLYADPIMQDLLGVTPDITPEECYAFFLGHIHPEDRPLMNAYQQELMRKLHRFGCAGSYSEREEMLAFFYDGFKIGR